MTSPAFTQLTFRGRNDDGSESAATWIAAAGADWTQDTGANFRVRFRIDETNSRAWTSKVWNLYYQLDGGGYSAVSGSTPVQYSLSGNFAQGDDCTEQLTGGTGTFVSDNNGMCESSGATNSGTAGYLFEVEYCLKIDSAQVTDGQTLNLRVYDGSSAIAVYTDTPVITVNVVSQNINETASAAKYKGITAGDQVSVQDTSSLANYKMITAGDQVNVIDATAAARYDGISALDNTNEQDGAAQAKYAGIGAVEILVVDETLYGA